MPLESNPFAILTFIAAPAILTNAASLLALGTSNRFARNVDRARVLIASLTEGGKASDDERAHFRRLLARNERRAELLVRAMSSFYFAIGCFAAGSLSSLVGAIVAPLGRPQISNPVLVLALVTGVGGLGGLIVGGGLLVRETRLAMETLRDEASFYREQYARVHGAPPH